MAIENTAGEGKVQFAIRSDAPTEIHKAVTDKNYGGDIRLTDTTPTIMIGHKGVKNLPLAMVASHIRQNILTEEEATAMGHPNDDDHHYHGLGEPLFEKVIDDLDNVKEAYRGTKFADDSERRENYFLLISEQIDADGNRINVPVYINEGAFFNRVYFKVNKAATVFGRDGLRDYINRQIKKKNLVRIKTKNRGPISSDSPALIAVEYADVTSSEEAADQTAMASYNISIRTTSENSQENF